MGGKSKLDGADVAAQLAKIKNYRWSIFVEEARVSGPEYRNHLPGTGPAPAVQFGNYQAVRIEDEFELAMWYRQYRFPQVSITPGCIGARKLLASAGWSKHGILYEFMDMPSEDSNFEHRFVAAGGAEWWTGRHVLEFVLHAPNAPHAGRRIWPVV